MRYGMNRGGSLERVGFMSGIRVLPLKNILLLGCRRVHFKYKTERPNPERRGGRGKDDLQREKEGATGSASVLSRRINIHSWPHAWNTHRVSSEAGCHYNVHSF